MTQRTWPRSVFTRTAPFVRVALLALLTLLASVALGVGPSASVAQAAKSKTAPIITDVQMFGFRNAVVRVTLKSAKPIAGPVEFHADGYSPVTTPVDLPSGGEKTVWLPIGTLHQYFKGSIVWDVPGDKDPSFEIAVTPSPGTFSPTPGALPTGTQGSISGYLALLPSALGSRHAPSTATVLNNLGSLQVAALSLDDIEQRAWILRGFTSLATTTKELATISPEARNAIFDWVNLGGELLIDDDAAIPLITKQPTREQNAFVGLGIVRRTYNSIRTGQWDRVMLPGIGIRRPSLAQEELVPLALPFVAEIGPGGALLGGLVVYGLLIAPLAYRFGRRLKRPLLLWAAVPLASVLMSSGIIAFGSVTRDQHHDKFIAFTWHAGVDHHTVFRAVTAKSELRRVSLPTGWTAAGKNIELSVGASMTSSVHLRPGQVTEIRFTGSSAKTKAPFSASVKNNIGNPSNDISITNPTKHVLTDVMLFLNIKGTLFGQTLNDVPAGKTIRETFELDPNSLYKPVGQGYGQGMLGVMSTLIDSSATFPENAYVVVANIEGTSNGTIPNLFTHGASKIQHYHALTIEPTDTRSSYPEGDPYTAYATVSVPQLVRVDLGDVHAAYRPIDGSYQDQLWVRGRQTSLDLIDTVPSEAIVNGAVLLQTTTGRLARDASANPEVSFK